MSLVLETKRLIMRGFQDSDIQDFAAYRTDPEVARYQGWDAPYSVAQASQFVAGNKVVQPDISGTWQQLALKRKADHNLIGDCAFHIFAEDARQAEIGFTLARHYQGQGYATEAVTRLVDYLFGERQLHRIRATCDVDNPASFRLLERIGMRREAHFIENIWFKGTWGSEYVYSLLRREWQK